MVCSFETLPSFLCKIKDPNFVKPLNSCIAVKKVFQLELSGLEYLGNVEFTNTFGCAF